MKTCDPSCLHGAPPGRVKQGLVLEEGVSSVQAGPQAGPAPGERMHTHAYAFRPCASGSRAGSQACGLLNKRFIDQNILSRNLQKVGAS